MENKYKYKYQLIKKPNNERNKFRITIKADYNDGDYITTINSYSLENFEKYIVDGLIDLQNNYSKDYDLQNYPNEYDTDIPYGDNGSCHTLESIDIEYIDADGEAFNVFLNLDAEISND